MELPVEVEKRKAARMTSRINLKTERIAKTQEMPTIASQRSDDEIVQCESDNSTRISNHPSSRLRTSFARLSHMECLGQYARGFFVAVLDGSFYILDQHAAS